VYERVVAAGSAVAFAAVSVAGAVVAAALLAAVFAAALLSGSFFVLLQASSNVPIRKMTHKMAKGCLALFILSMPP
jgi:hypothetical protein